MKKLVLYFVAYTAAAIDVSDDFDPEKDEITDEMYDQAYRKVRGERADWEFDFSEDPEIED